jgi:putative transposase
MDKKLPQRKPNRLKKYDYSQNGAYFITICTANRAKILSKIRPISPIVGADIIRPFIELLPTGKITDDAMKNIPEIYAGTFIDNYIIMPNHIHLILIIENHNGQHDGQIYNGQNGRMVSAPTGVSTIIGSLKRFVSKQCGKQIWQKSFHDRIIRNEREFLAISKYIDNNPINWINDVFNKPNLKSDILEDVDDELRRITWPEEQ